MNVRGFAPGFEPKPFVSGSRTLVPPLHETTQQPLGAARARAHLDVLLVRGDDALPHEEAVVLKEPGVLLRLLPALVEQEADDPLLQDVTQLPVGGAGRETHRSG